MSQRRIIYLYISSSLYLDASIDLITDSGKYINTWSGLLRESIL
ncbi:hypothetical protein NYZ99_12940 [Maribacter litopenaei]|uniref:Uncharacterized protein n=1 Tax=Maribacter litopenaei TaxID=2976127 RepID=A0ABY5Y4P4_9FLAO|nr:hypothetical protein [Maribacter litopenaei]UWX53980.1 hypothetical protein NYZ99_12940 [Maribacter litopenaei]